MKAVMGELKASVAFIERNFNLFKRYKGWEAVFLVYTVVNTLTIAFIGYGNPDKILYLVIGSLMWSFLSVLFHEVSEAVAWERWEGTIEYTFMAPIHRFTHLMGQCSFAILYGILRSLVILTVIGIFFDLDFGKANFGAALATLLVASFSFLGMGLMAATLPLLSPERGPQATHIFQALILLISGVYYEVEVLPGWLQPFSRLSPGTYTLRSIRAAMLHGAGFREIAGDLCLLVVIGFVLIPLGLMVFHQAEVYAKRTGKLKRSG
jgi:ABC-2 type transport system permease protein